MWMKEFYAIWMSIPYQQEKKEYQLHPENFGSSLIGIDEGEFDYLNEMLEKLINKEDFLQGKNCIIYWNGLILQLQICWEKNIPVLTWKALEKSGTVVERIKGVE